MVPSNSPFSLTAEEESRAIEDWRAFLRFPSVSADPAHDADCRACAAWLCNHLGRMGLHAEQVETSGKPVVFAERRGRPGAPTVLLYGHYDVQPADPLDQWRTPPFEPDLRDGRLYARGAEDNKGQVLFALTAVESLIRRGALRPTLKVIVEGEEEHGSRGITHFLDTQPERVKADVLLVNDCQAVRTGQPTIVMGLRGVLSLTIRLDGARHDLHSGVHGGLAPNAATALARLLATLHHPDGRVAVEGFYDGVEAPSAEERTLANAVAEDATAYQAAVGVPPVAGEPGFTAAERVGFRPCLDVNGVHGGYGGAGSKTIIPASALAKISARIVAGQEPKAVMDAITRHLERHAPAGLRLALSDRSMPGPALRLRLDSPVAQRARAVLEANGEPVAFLWDGASIPVVARLAQASGAQPLLVGFGLESDCIHAPNESFALEQFRKGHAFVAAFLAGM
jgi:acetylornithine deacetylase/succinyl-diaminopimelate desuccinylase-like protein